LSFISADSSRRGGSKNNIFEKCFVANEIKFTVYETLPVGLMYKNWKNSNQFVYNFTKLCLNLQSLQKHEEIMQYPKP
jgi:hypothetical protein